MKKRERFDNWSFNFRTAVEESNVESLLIIYDKKLGSLYTEELAGVRSTFGGL
jgi:hypothetical protein